MEICPYTHIHIRKNEICPYIYNLEFFQICPLGGLARSPAPLSACMSIG